MKSSSAYIATFVFILAGLSSASLAKGADKDCFETASTQMEITDCSAKRAEGNLCGYSIIDDLDPSPENPLYESEKKGVKFHPPRTQAERALAHILHLDYSDKSFRSFILKATERNKTLDKNYANLFTLKIERAWEEAYLSIAPEPESKNDERYVPIGFILCGQESSSHYLYATATEDESEAYISVVWPGEPVSTEHMRHPLRMIKENGMWKLDGVKCPAGFDFDTDFHYTK